MNRDREMAAIEELMRLDRLPTPTQLKYNDLGKLLFRRIYESSHEAIFADCLVNDVASTSP
jgi:hypothetical protein